MRKNQELNPLCFIEAFFLGKNFDLWTIADVLTSLRSGQATVRHSASPFDSMI
jgi:hypothetical protein